MFNFTSFPSLFSSKIEPNLPGSVFSARRATIHSFSFLFNSFKWHKIIKTNKSHLSVAFRVFGVSLFIQLFPV
jgi:hypothetical protein